MGLNYHPVQGTIVICDFNGFVVPEMVKKRPALIISPKFRHRDRLCSVVPLSTTEPQKIMPYHHKLHIKPPLPKPFDSDFKWVKADMIYTVSFSRLTLPFNGKDASGKRIYIDYVIEKSDLIKIQQCVLHGLGLTSLTDYL